MRDAESRSPRRYDGIASPSRSGRSREREMGPEMGGLLVTAAAWLMTLLGWTCSMDRLTLRERPTSESLS